MATNTAATTGGSFNGTLSGSGASIVSGGRAGNALSLDRASGGFVTVDNFPSFDPGTNFTLVAWVRSTDGTTDSFIVGRHSVAPNNGYSLRLNPTGAPGMVHFSDNGIIAEGVTAGTVVNDGNWHQIVAVYNSAAAMKSIFVDGAPFEASTDIQPLALNTLNFLIGGVTAGITQTAAFTGAIDDVQVYARALSDAEIDYLFLNPGAEIVSTVVTGTVLNAIVRNQVITGAVVTINGATQTTSALGTFTFTNVPATVITVTASASGYANYTNTFALTVTPTNTISFAMSPAIANANSMRFVLNWGATPSDLDSHLRTPLIGGTVYDVSWTNTGSLTVNPFASLDVDDVTAFGPETITITNFSTGTYHYYIANYSGQYGDTPLTQSRATAQIYGGNGLLANLSVPAGGTGLYWYVARVDGGSRILTIINYITNQVPVIAGAPTFTAVPQSVTTNNGATVQFSVSATGTAPLSYQWRLNGADIPGATGTTLALNGVQISSAGQYDCVASNPVGSGASPAATLAINAIAPFINVQPGSFRVPPGTNVTFFVTVGGLRPLTYQWRYNGVNVPGATGASLRLDDVQPASSGDYSVVIRNAFGMATSASGNLDVLTAPVIITQLLGSTNQAGDTVSFSVETIGSLPLSYQWRFNGTNVLGELTSTLTLEDVRVTAAGLYSVVVSNAAGVAVSSNAVLAVNSPPVIVTPPAARIVNAADSVSFAVSALGDAPFTYQWRRNGTNLAGATAATYSIAAVTPSHEGLYSVVVSNLLGFATSSAARLTVLPLSVVVPWVAPGGGSGSDAGNAIAVDAAGNSYVAGYFTGTATFGTNTLVSAGNTDIFIAKHDSNGQLLWVRRAGGPGYDTAKGIAVDTAGNCYVTGAYEGEATFGSTTLTNTSPTSYSDVFLAKYDSAGSLVWARSTGVEFADDEGAAVAVDGAGNVLVTGRSVLDTFAGAALTNSGRVFVAKYTGAGVEVWARKAGSYSGGNLDAGTGIAADSVGNVFVSGVFYSPVATFGVDTLTNRGNSDMFLAKFDAVGTLLWVRQAGGAGEDTANGVAVAADGSAYLAGATFGTAAFSGSNVTSLAGAASDAFIAKYAGNGGVLWVRQMGGSGLSAAHGVAVDAAGTVHVTGYFSGGATFGTNALGGISGSYDAFLTRLDANGVFAFAQQAGGPDLSGDFGLGVGADAAGNSYIAGYFSGTSSAGGSPLPSRGAEDVLVARFNQFTGGGTPQLGLLRMGGQFRMRWPLASSGYILQSTTNLLAPVWQDETNALTLNGSELETDVTPGNRVRFFRLRRP